MSFELILAVVTVFAAVSLVAYAIATTVLTRTSPERRRLRSIGATTASGVVLEGSLLADNISPRLRSV